MKFDYKNIAGTLKLGIKYPKLFYAVMLSTLGGVALTFLIILIIQQFCDIGLDAEDQLFYLIFGLICLVGFFLVACLLFKEQYIWKKKISEYFNDENLLYLQVFPYTFSTDGFGIYARLKIGIKFEYNGEIINVQSAKYSKQFYKYVDRQINIAYSPKYDQIVIFKN